MPPERANLVLTSDVPNGERDVLVLDRLDVESCTTGGSADDIGRYAETRTDCRNSGHDLTKLELVEDGRLTSGIETDL